MDKAHECHHFYLGSGKKIVGFDSYKTQQMATSPVHFSAMDLHADDNAYIGRLLVWGLHWRQVYKDQQPAKREASDLNRTSSMQAYGIRSLLTGRRGSEKALNRCVKRREFFLIRKLKLQRHKMRHSQWKWLWEIESLAIDCEENLVKHRSYVKNLSVG